MVEVVAGGEGLVTALLEQSHSLMATVNVGAAALGLACREAQGCSLTNSSWYEQRLYPYTWALSRLIELMNKENMPRELCATDNGLRWRTIRVTPHL
jgi:hypothetical protein